MKNEQWDYKVDGKNGGIIRLILLLVISIFFVVLAIDQLPTRPNKSLFVALFFCCIALVLLRFLITLTIRYFCFKVYIGRNGFYFQTNPFNGKYYRYVDIKRCTEELSTSYHRHAGGTFYGYFLVFTEKNGKSTRFQFEKDLYEHEINILKKRIEISN